MSTILKKLTFPEENQSEQIANLPNIAVLLSTVNPQKTPQLTMLGNSRDVSQVSINQTYLPLSKSSVFLTLPSKMFSFSPGENPKVVFVLFRKQDFSRHLQNIMQKEVQRSEATSSLHLLLEK